MHPTDMIKFIIYVISLPDPPATFQLTNLNTGDDGVVTGTIVTYAIDGYQLFMSSTSVFFANVSAI